MKAVAASLTNEQKKWLAYATGGALLIGFWFLRSYFAIFTFAAILAFVFLPVYRLFLKKMGSGAASALTLLVSIICVLVPLTLVVMLATGQVKNLSDNVSTYVNTVDFGELGEKTITNVNNFLDGVPFVDYELTEEKVVDGVKKGASAFGGAFLRYVSSTVSSALGVLTSAIIFIYIFLSLLKHHESLVEAAIRLNPLGEKASKLYLTRITAMVKGTVNGQFVIAIAQGLIGAATFAVVGYPEFFFILFLVFSLLSLIPLGAGILSIPLAVLLLLFGNVSGGIIVLLSHLIINTNIDNILRPILVPKAARLDAALMMVSVFAGIGFFGFLGIVVGPTLMIILVTTVRLYLETKKNAAA